MLVLGLSQQFRALSGFEFLVDVFRYERIAAGSSWAAFSSSLRNDSREAGLGQTVIGALLRARPRILLKGDTNLLRFPRAPIGELPLQNRLQGRFAQLRRSAEYVRIGHAAGLIERDFQRHRPVNAVFIGGFRIWDPLAVQHFAGR